MSRVPSRLRVVVTVEDHVLGTVLCEALQDDGYEAVHFDRVTEARTFVIEHMPDVVLLDLPYEHSPRDPQLRNRTTARPHMSSVSLRTTQETLSPQLSAPLAWAVVPFRCQYMAARRRVLPQHRLPTTRVCCVGRVLILDTRRGLPQKPVHHTDRTFPPGLH